MSRKRNSDASQEHIGLRIHSGGTLEVSINQQNSEPQLVQPLSIRSFLLAHLPALFDLLSRKTTNCSFV